MLSSLPRPSSGDVIKSFGAGLLCYVCVWVHTWIGLYVFWLSIMSLECWLSLPNWVFLFASGNVTEAIACSEWLTMVYDFALILPHILSAQKCCCLIEDWNPLCLEYFLQQNGILYWRSVVLLLSHGFWVFIGEICTHISANPSHLISHCICLNTKTPNAQKLDSVPSASVPKTPWTCKLDMQTPDRLLQYQNPLSTKVMHADCQSFA